MLELFGKHGELVKLPVVVDERPIGMIIRRKETFVMRVHGSAGERIAPHIPNPRQSPPK